MTFTNMLKFEPIEDPVIRELLEARLNTVEPKTVMLIGPDDAVN